MTTWSYVALIVRISLWVIIQVLIVRLFLAAVVLNVGWPDRGNVDETVLFVVVVGLVIVVGTEIGTPIVCQGRELQSRRLEQGGRNVFRFVAVYFVA